jgi:glycosyltransferase involved in cell wall biosynthesis
MVDDIKLNLAGARPNQNVHLTYEGSQMCIELAQDNSNSCVLFEETYLSKGLHFFKIDCNTSAHKVFSIAFFHQNLPGQKMRVLQRIPQGGSELSISFKVTSDGLYTPAILANLGKSGEKLLVNSCNIVKPFRSAEEHRAEAEKHHDAILDDANNVASEVIPEHNQAETDFEAAFDSISDDTLEAGLPSIVSAKASKLNFLVESHKMGGSFVRELSRIMPVETITSIEQAVENVLAKGLPLCVNGFNNETEELATKYPGQLHCFWHSSLRGIEMMRELQMYCRFLRAIQHGLVSGYFLNEDECLPIGAHRFWLPFQLNQNQFNTNAQLDFALPLASPESLVCKDIFQTICVLLQGNYSFVMPKRYAQIYDIDALKQAFGSSSRVEQFDTQTSPIEHDYFKMAKIYLSASITDTMPFACVEALNSGVPFLVSKNVGWARALGDLKGISPILSTVAEIPKVYEGLNKNKTALKYLYEQQHALLKMVSKRNNMQMLKSFFEDEPSVEVNISIHSISDPSICLFVMEQMRDGLYLTLQRSELLRKDDKAVLSFTFLTSRHKKEGYKGSEDVAWFLDAYMPLFETTVSYEGITWEILQATYTVANIFWDIDKNGKLRLDQGLEDVIMLGVDRLGWAFDNISKQVLNATSHHGLMIVKCEYFFILLLLKIFEIKTNIVCFWWRSLELMAQESPASRFAMMLYDHYSWSSSPNELLSAANKATVIGVANPKLRQELKGLGVSKPVFVVKDGVDFEIFPLKNTVASTSKFTFGWIGNAQIQKSAGFEGHDFKGFSLIQSALEGTEFGFEYYDVSQRKPIPHNEVFDQFYSKIDCYICASESEGTPNTVFESLACGIPVITTDVGNVQDVVIDGVNGMIIERSVEQIRAAMYRIAADREHYAQNRHNIREGVRDFEWSVKVLVWLQLLRYLLK